MEIPASNFSYIVTLIVVACVLLITSMMLYKHRVSRDSHKDATVVGNKLKSNLTQIRWYSEMMLNQDFGKLKFSQVEYLHQANQACEQAIRNLRRLLKDEGLEKTSTELENILKNRKEESS